MNIVIAADHGGFELKQKVVLMLEKLNYSVDDVGCSSTDSVDYPDYANKLVDKVEGTKDLGILICGTGIGMSIAANRNRSIRAALCHDVNTAILSREHNNANVLCLGARVLEENVAIDIIKAWLKTEFAGGRHLQRISKFSDL